MWLPDQNKIQPHLQARPASPGTAPATVSCFSPRVVFAGACSGWNLCPQVVAELSFHLPRLLPLQLLNIGNDRKAEPVTKRTRVRSTTAGRDISPRNSVKFLRKKTHNCLWTVGNCYIHSRKLLQRLHRRTPLSLLSLEIWRSLSAKATHLFIWNVLS